MNENIETIRKYNPWEGKMLPAGMSRIYYTEKIEQYIGSRLVKVLVGQRRSGKSFILRQIMNSLLQKGIKGKNMLFISKEFIEYSFVEDFMTLEAIYQSYLEVLKPEGKIYLFIDEVQNIKGWEKFVNSHSQDFTADVEIFISGSNSKMLSTELATLLSGRYVEFPIYPFRYEEYVEMNQDSVGRQSYIKYLKDGGLPGMFELQSIESKVQYVSSVKDTIMLRDIIQRKQNETNTASVRDAKLLDDIFVYLVSNASNPISIQNIIKFFKGKQRKVAYETVSNYISYIVETFLTHPVRRYNIKGKSVSENPFKYYSNDLAFKNYLYPGIAYGIGYLLENAVFLELLKQGFSVYEGEGKDKEVDFVAIKGDRKIYVQCAYMIEDEDTKHREYASLLEIKDSYEKWIVTLDEVQYPILEGIKHIQAWELSKYF